MRIGVTKGSKPDGQAPLSPHPTQTVNKSGGVAFDLTDPSQKLVSLVGQFLNEPKYYPDDPTVKTASGLDSEAQALIDTAVAVLDGPTPEDLFAVARWARSEGNLRTTPNVLLAIAAEDPNAPKSQGGKGKPGRRFGMLVRLYAPLVMLRADEPRNTFAAWRALYGKMQGPRCTVVPPNGLKSAIRSVVKRTPEHKLAKYQGTGRPSFADMIRACARDLVRDPKVMFFVDKEAWLKGGEDGKFQKRFDPAEATPVLWARTKLFEQKVFDAGAMKLAWACRATWEDLVSHFGSDPAVWAYVMPQMQYMAVLRNLRNFVEKDLPLGGVIEKLTDRGEVLASRQLPFRFLSAAKALEGMTAKDPRKVQDLVNALEVALEHSLANLPDLPGETAVFIDVSGSMSSARVSGNSEVSCMEAAATLGVLIAKKCKGARVVLFGDRAQELIFKAKDGTLTTVKEIMRNRQGSTQAHFAFRLLRDKGYAVDRIIMLSDMQCYTVVGYGSVRQELQSLRQVAKKPIWLHTVNMAGTEQAQVAGDDDHVNLLSGYSESLLQIMVGAEAGAAVAGEVTAATPKALPTIEYIRSKYLLRGSAPAEAQKAESPEDAGENEKDQ